MKRVLTFVAIVVLLPMAVAAQVPPTPPPPAPPAIPVPVVVPPIPPLPPDALPTPRAPRPVIAPTAIEPWELEHTLRAATEAQREAQRINADAVREAVRAADIQVRDMRWATPVHAGDFHFDYMDWQPFGQESNSAFNQGRSFLDQRQYERAIASFDRVIAQKSTRSDAALYYKAYSQWKLGRPDDAVATINQLRKEYPQSRYLKDASALEVDVKKTPPQQIVDNDEIKLLAINAMKDTDPERAVPLLEDVLNKTNSLRVKRGALSVLAHINTPRTRQILLSYAKGSGNPDLQMEAIRYIAVNRDNQTTGTDLRQIYEATDDVNVRRAIIAAYQSSGNKTELVRIAGTAGAPVAVRQQAISGLTNIAAPQELWALYQKETDKDLKIQMIRAFSAMGAVEQLTQILKTEKDPDVRRQAIRSLGGQKTTTQMLVDLYASEQDLENRKAVISALSSQENAEALIAVARKETNLPLKTEIVRRLSEMANRGNKVAGEYMLEILK